MRGRNRKHDSPVAGERDENAGGVPLRLAQPLGRSEMLGQADPMILIEIDDWYIVWYGLAGRADLDLESLSVVKREFETALLRVES